MMDIRFDDRAGTVAVGHAVLSYGTAADGALDVGGVRLAAPTHEARSLAVARALLAPAPAQALCSALRAAGGADAACDGEAAVDAVALWLAGADAEAVSFGDALAALLRAGGDVAGAVRLPARQFDELVAALASATDGDEWETIRFDGAPGGSDPLDVRARLAARLLRRGTPGAEPAGGGAGEPAAWPARLSGHPTAARDVARLIGPPATAPAWPQDDARPNAPADGPAEAARGADPQVATAAAAGSTASPAGIARAAVSAASRAGAPPTVPTTTMPGGAPAAASSPGGATPATSTPLADAARPAGLQQPLATPGVRGPTASPAAAFDAPAAVAPVARSFDEPRREDAPSAPRARAPLALVDDPSRHARRARGRHAGPGDVGGARDDETPSADVSPARPALAGVPQWSDVADALGHVLDEQADLRGLSR